MTLSLVLGPVGWAVAPSTCASLSASVLATKYIHCTPSFAGYGAFILHTTLESAKGLAAPPALSRLEQPAAVSEDHVESQNAEGDMGNRPPLVAPMVVAPQCNCPTGKSDLIHRMGFDQATS